MQNDARHPADDQDQLVLDGICGYEDYMDAHTLACHHLKQGFLKLAMARMRLPAHALSEVSYKEYFDASVVVEDRPTGLMMATEHSNTCSQHGDGSPTSASSLVRRKHAQDATVEGEDSEESSRKKAKPAQQDAEQSTILWFSSLPPSDLRQAQKQFAHGLQLLVTAAGSARQVHKSVSALS